MTQTNRSVFSWLVVVFHSTYTLLPTIDGYQFPWLLFQNPKYYIDKTDSMTFLKDLCRLLCLMNPLGHKF